MTFPISVIKEFLHGEFFSDLNKHIWECSDVKSAFLKVFFTQVDRNL